MKIYTKTGDSGETGLYRGGRVKKDSLPGEELERGKQKDVIVKKGFN